METSCTTRPGVLAAFRRRLPASLLSGVTLVIHMVLASGCNYYWPQQQTADPAGVASLASSKLFLVHQGNSVWQLQNPQLSGEALQGQKADLTLELRQYATPIIGQGLRYKRRDKHTALNLVHLYLTDSHTFTGSQVSIPLADMQRLEVIERDTGKTIFSHVLVGAGVVGGAYVILGIIVLLTKSSCPFVYAYDGANYQFVGEAYGGAIFAPAERDDYMPLPNLQAQGQDYQLKITNELRERQYTNVAELWLVHHPAATSVLIDSQGNMHTIGRPMAAVQATSDAGTNYTTHLATRDKSALLFNDETPGTAPNSVVLTFPNPTQARLASWYYTPKTPCGWITSTASSQRNSGRTTASGPAPSTTYQRGSYGSGRSNRAFRCEYP
ncbi:hypothetical protein [Hymenobacter sp. AT01-02]|uniref:hypothetical protein n=1 Tax=Hymenobacter sp. AT01-02 TaxID=1571877 RepID=UPI000A9AA553|nr:hypothetical protein [Hymenobacter sp. AT01-02]